MNKDQLKNDETMKLSEDMLEGVSGGKNPNDPDNCRSQGPTCRYCSANCIYAGNKK